jgi:hypothetical protein
MTAAIARLMACSCNSIEVRGTALALVSDRLLRNALRNCSSGATRWGSRMKVDGNRQDLRVAGARSGAFPRVLAMALPIFVFGTDLLGRHQGEVGRHAREYGATVGLPRGPQGGSYAIPVCDAQLLPRPLEAIKGEIDFFLEYASAHPELVFNVTRIGCGEGEHPAHSIAPMFQNATTNCVLPLEFLSLIRYPDRRAMSSR